MLSRNVFSRWTIPLESWVRGKELTMRGNVYLDISYLAMPGSCLTQKGKRKEKKKKWAFFKDYRSPGLLWIPESHCVLNAGR